MTIVFFHDDARGKFGWMSGFPRIFFIQIYLSSQGLYFCLQLMQAQHKHIRRF